MKISQNSAILLAHCPDAKGILYAITAFILNNNGNIVELDEHVDSDEDQFFVRVHWDISEFTIPRNKINDFFATLIGTRFNMSWKLYLSSERPRIAIFVSKYAHCLYDILARYESGEWDVEIPVMISNHEKFKNLAERYKIPFYHFPITKQNKIDQEQREIELLQSKSIDLIVLARYMQILSPQITDTYPYQIINIHHSSLPAFAGANPYKAAYMRGVKFMGATSHYVTEDLDEGPIIAQDVIPISHRDSISEMKRKGRDIEKIVLAKAVWYHLNRKVLIYKNRTVVFD